MSTRFRDRTDAGIRLAEVVARADVGEDVVVLGLPRGGIPVAFEVARRLGAPLDVIVVRKIGVPFQPELAMGAIGEDGVRVENEEVQRAARVSRADLDAVEQRERVELERRARSYRRGRPRVDLAGRCAVIVDDGIATGSTAQAACLVARAHGAARVVLAAPVASQASVLALRPECDDMLWVETPEPFFAVGEWYQDFSQTSDDEVVRLLERAGAREGVELVPSALRPRRAAAANREVVIASESARLVGALVVPADALGTVLFAHGSGSSRHSPRNRYVAGVLNEAGVATLLLDLLTVDEESDRARVFDIALLGERLVDATRWVRAHPEVTPEPVGYFGASTGAAAALWAAARPDTKVAAVVSRGGRPDLAAAVLSAVDAPTLLIVGGQDRLVLDLNRRARTELSIESDLAVVPGATHLFEEPGALEEVARLARDWFVAKLRASAARDSLA